MLQLQNREINEYQLKKINKWSTDEISIFKSIYEKKFSQNPKEAEECLNTIYEYRLPFSQCSDLNIYKLHKFGIDKFNVTVSKNRTIEELIPNHNDLIQEKQLSNYSHDNDTKIIKRVNNIKNLYKKYLNKNINKENISEDLKTKEDDLIAIAMSTLKTKKDILLRDSQLYSLILFLNKPRDKGKIINVFSGEGKTIITFCLSIVLVLKGHKVDIICKNLELVKRDSKEAEQILEKLKISVGNNIKTENDCYKKDVLYGVISNFQGGIMRDGYQLNGERQNRSFDIVIVDEIDSMLLDDYSQSTRLTSPKPFIEKYSVFLLILWGYYKNLHLNKYDINNNIILKEKLKIFLIEKIKQFININDEKSEFFFPMSNLIKNFALDQAPEWINNLIKTLSYRKNVEYVVKNDEIFPIDIGFTGLIEKDKSLDRGLQQFLQVQNNLPVTPISTISSSNFLSNYGFYQKYKNKDKNCIYGCTGAIGSIKSRELMEKLYQIEFDYIPTNNTYLLKELTSNISLNHEIWIENILRIIKREINSGRGVLVLCETVEYCEEIYEKIGINFPNFNLIKIIGDDNEKSLISKNINQKTVIISTDMSGEGYDFIICESILKNGGLHIIFSFIPGNSRMEEKNYKNAGKAGSPGTFQYVLDFKETMDKFYVDYDIENHYRQYQNLLKIENKNEEELKKIDTYSIENIKNLRENRVITRCNKTLDEINNTKQKDFLFNIYCNMVEERKELRETENKECLSSIEEQWGIFQYNLNINNKNFNQIKLECDNFKNNIFSELDKGKVIKNSGYYNQYVNSKLNSIYNYFKGKNIIYEIKENNFQTANKIFVKKKEETFEYDKYLEKCDASIELDKYSYIPYYLKGIVKVMCGKNGIDEMKKSLYYLEEEIKRYFHLFGLFISLNINIDLIFHEINILNNIKNNVIQKNINYYEKYSDMNKGDFRIYSKISKNCFYFEEEEEEKEDEKKEIENNTNNKKFPKYLKEYYSNFENNGLKNFFFFQKPSTWNINSTIITGIIMIYLSVIGNSFQENILTEEVFSIIGNFLKTSLSFKEYENWLKKKHEKHFPFSDDKSFSQFIEKKNIKIKNIEFDLNEILIKYDSEYKNKINKEKEKIFRKIFWKKIKKLNLEKINDLIEKKETEEDECQNADLDQFLNKLLDNIDEKKRKLILANNFMRRDGRDWLTDESREGKDINERIEKSFNELNDVADSVIVNELKQLLDLEINSKKQLKNDKDEEYNKQKEIYEKKKKEYQDFLNSYREKEKIYNAKMDNQNNNIKIYNNNLEEYKKDNSKVDKEKLDKDNKEIEKTREQLNKENEKLNKIFEEVGEKRIEVNKENDKLNKLIDEYNYLNKLCNERINLYNNLKENLIIDFSKDELKITIKKNDLEMPNFYNGIKEIEKDSNLAFKDELKKIAKFEEEKKNDIIKLEKKNEFEQLLLKIIKEKHYYWDNCFNKAFYALKYIYNINNKKDDYYYIKDINNKKSIKKAKEKLKNNKIILGNYCNKNNIWDSYCIIPYNNSNIFLYKSPEGKNPSRKVVDAVQEITEGEYISKINKLITKKEKELSEVDAIENNKIMMGQIECNKDEFINNFEKYSKFYNKDKEAKEKIKQKIYPEEYIKGLYNEIKKRNNTLRISIIFFKNYFLNEEKENEIDIDFLNQIYYILLNFEQIDDKEKEILKDEYSEIINIYNKIYAEIKKKEEQEEKEVEEIVQNKKKHKRSLKNKKYEGNNNKDNKENSNNNNEFDNNNNNNEFDNNNNNEFDNNGNNINEYKDNKYNNYENIENIVNNKENNYYLNEYKNDENNDNIEHNDNNNNNNNIDNYNTDNDNNNINENNNIDNYNNDNYNNDNNDNNDINNYNINNININEKKGNFDRDNLNENNENLYSKDIKEINRKETQKVRSTKIIIKKKKKIIKKKKTKNSINKNEINNLLNENENKNIYSLKINQNQNQNQKNILNENEDINYIKIDNKKGQNIQTKDIKNSMSSLNDNESQGNNKDINEINIYNKKINKLNNYKAKHKSLRSIYNKSNSSRYIENQNSKASFENMNNFDKNIDNELCMNNNNIYIYNKIIQGCEVNDDFDKQNNKKDNKQMNCCQKLCDCFKK